MERDEEFIKWLIESKQIGMEEIDEFFSRADITDMIVAVHAIICNKVHNDKIEIDGIELLNGVYNCMFYTELYHKEGERYRQFEKLTREIMKITDDFSEIKLIAQALSALKKFGADVICSIKVPD
jgi:hypothetical protein